MISQVSLIAELWAVAPMIILTVGALLMLVIDVFAKGSWPRAGLAYVTVIAAMLSSLYPYDALPGGTAFYNAVYVDSLAQFICMLISGGSLLTLMIGARGLEGEGIESRAEFLSLFLMCGVGTMIFATAADLVTLFIGLEAMSLALYCMCGAAIRLKRSAEAALKYFLLGSFSSAFLLYGIALLYGLTGSTQLETIASRMSEIDGPIAYLAIGLLFIGFIFKIGAVPLHFWAPDVYQGSPTTVTAYMACVIKASAVVAALRTVWVAFGETTLIRGGIAVPVLSGAISIVAVVTMFVGNLSALRQRSMKRMLAYSSIAHAGYMLIAFLALGENFGGGAAVLYYLVAYMVMTMGAFGVVRLVAGQHAGDEMSDDIARFRSLGRRSPMVAALMSLFMLSLAGLPPGLGGLLGKFFIFNAAIQADYVGVVIFAVINSAISAYYYLRVIVAMYFDEDPHAESSHGSEPALELAPAMAAALFFCALCSIALGAAPSAVHQVAELVLVGL